MSRYLFLIPIVFALDVPAKAQVDVVPRKADDGPSQLVAVPQDDPGNCSFDSKLQVVTIFPPKSFATPKGQNCSVTCKFSSAGAVTMLGCDLSMAAQADGSICRRQLSNDGAPNSLQLIGNAILACSPDAP